MGTPKPEEGKEKFKQHKLQAPKRSHQKMEFYHGNVQNESNLETEDDFYRKLLALKSENKLFLDTVLSKLKDTGKFKKPVVKWRYDQPDSVSSDGSEEVSGGCDNANQEVKNYQLQ